MPAGGGQQVSPAGQTYHRQPFALVGEYSHRRPDRQLIYHHRLSMDISYHPKNKPPVYTFVGGMLSKIRC